MRKVSVCHSALVGGAERYLVELDSGLSRLGADVHLVGHLPNWPTDRLAASEVGLSPKWDKRTIAAGIARLPTEVRRIRSAVTAAGPFDVAHVQFKREQIGLTRALSKSARVFWTEHGRFGTGPHARALAAAYRQASHNVESVVCVSDEVADDVSHILRGRVPVHVIETATDTSRFVPVGRDGRREAKLRAGLDAEEPVALWLGRLAENKLPLLPVSVGRTFAGTTLIAGDGPMRSDVAQAASAAAGVRFLGPVQDPVAYYAAADVVIFSSTGVGEGLPTILIEAAAMGLPIVATAGSGLDEHIRKAGGVLVDADAPRSEWAAELTAAVSRGPDSEARAWALSHDVKPWLSRHLAVFGDS